MAAINERLWEAATRGDAVKLKVLLRNPDSDALVKCEQGTTALMLTACHGHEACLRILLPISDALAKEDDGSTALILAASYGLEACVRLLLPVSDALAKDNAGRTASCWAQREGHESLAQFIDAYALSQTEPAAFKVKVGDSAPSGRAAPRVLVLIQ